MSDLNNTELLDEDSQKGRYMTFKSGNEYYAIGLQYVSEIIQYQKITIVPETADYIKGLINLRGKIIPVIDVRLRFKQPPFEYNERTCIIVVDVKSTLVGLIVETIAEVVTIEEESILPPPSIGRGEKDSNKFVYGIGKVGDSVKLMLDPDKLLHDEEANTLEQTGTYNETEE